MNQGPQLSLNGKLCNASMTIIFHDENDNLCVILQKNSKGPTPQWTGAAGKVEVKDQENTDPILNELLHKQFENELVTFAKAALRENSEEQGYPLLKEIQEEKAKIFYFDRNNNNMKEQDQRYRSEIFYTYLLGNRKRNDIAKLIVAPGTNDSEKVIIASISNIEILEYDDSKNAKKATLNEPNQESLSVRPSTASFLLKINPLLLLPSQSYLPYATLSPPPKKVEITTHANNDDVASKTKFGNK